MQIYSILIIILLCSLIAYIGSEIFINVNISKEIKSNILLKEYDINMNICKFLVLPKMLFFWKLFWGIL